MKTTIKVLTIALAIFTFLSFQQKANLKTVKIGNQEWMAENLNVDHYRNGDSIPEVLDSTKWSQLATGAWCYYENKTENGTTYGKLYNWYAVNDPKGLSPEGWHIPTDTEWTTLAEYLGGNDVAGKKMKSTNGWDKNGNGDNSSGFTGLPAGTRGNTGRFFVIGSYGFWWSSTEVQDSTGSAWNCYLSRNSDGALKGLTLENIGRSVRCLKD